MTDFKKFDKGKLNKPNSYWPKDPERSDSPI